jgi:hypothetical protein
MPEKTPFCGPQFSCQKMFTSDSGELKYINLHRPEHHQVARQKNLTIRSPPRRVEPALHSHFNPQTVSVEDLNWFPYVKHVEHIADSESEQPQTLPQTDICLGASAPLIDYMGQPWECDAQGCLETNLHNTPYYPFAMC